MHKPSLVLSIAAGVLLSGAGLAQTKPATNTHSTTTSRTRTATRKPAAKAAKKAETVTLTTDQEKLSYAIGMSIGHSLMQQGVDIKGALVAQGLKDVLSGAKPLLTDADAQATLAKARQEMMQKAEQERQAAAQKNKQEGDAFLAANKTKPGVVTLPDGLQYKIITEGTGPKPAPTDTVACDYRGTLVDGKEFDSSYKRGQPLSIPVNGVIKGWSEALQLMPVGSKWQLFIPSDLAYGERGAGNGEIPPNATLIFEVELKSIASAQKPAEAPAPTSPK